MKSWKSLAAAALLSLAPAVQAQDAPAQDTPAQDAPAEVTLNPRGHGWLLADANGMSLYTFTADQEPGKSACNAQCAALWPPLQAPEGAAAHGDWSVIARDDGSRQWAFRDQPLYTYSRDVAPGDANGDEVNQQWFVAVKPIVMPPGFGVMKTPHGQLLVDIKRMTLYTSAADKPGMSACNGACVRTWRPVEAPWLAQAPDAHWTVVAREDGTKQWAFKGQALYRYAGDFNPGELAGDGVDSFAALVLDPPPPVPAWVTVQKSDGGELYADPNGKTLYAHDFQRRRGRGLGPTNGIERPYDWEPVLAGSEDQAVGNWSIIAREDGTKQWAFKGLPLYVNLRDIYPGDINGVRSTDRVWRPLMTNGQTMPGTGA